MTLLHAWKDGMINIMIKPRLQRGNGILRLPFDTMIHSQTGRACFLQRLSGAKSGAR